MRTTIDIPDALFRQVKSRAALRGQKLKDYVTEALRDSLVRHEPAGEVREAEEPFAGAGVLDLGEDCVFPLISGEVGEEMASISGARIAELLAEEEAEAADPPG